MKKLLSLSLMLSLGLTTVTPALNAAQSQTVAQSQKNPADASGWQAAKKWWRSGRKMSALNPQEQQAFKSLMKKFAIGAIIAAIVGGAALAIGYKKRQAGQEAPTAPPSARPTPRATGPTATPVKAVHLRQELRAAVRRGNNDKVKRLIAAGIDVNLANSLLISAAFYGRENIVERLLQVEGIDVNAADQYGWTALMSAANNGPKKIVEILLSNGANPSIQNNEDETAEAIARRRERHEIADIIRDYRPSGGLTKSAGKTE